jgi:uncharacterized membrane protein YhfC
MVSILSVVSITVSILICFLFPAALAIYFYKREGIPVKAILIGALTFLIVQPLTRIPILRYLENMPWFVINITTSTWAVALFYGITAGIFEECGRFVAFKYILKDKLNWKDGLAFGIGHGGFEAWYLAAAMGPVKTLYSMILLKMGKLSLVMTAKGASKTLIEATQNALITVHSYSLLLMGIERIFAITIQIALSLVVLYGVKNRKYIYLLYAILLHALVDSPIVLIHNAALIELYVLICAAISLVFIIRSKKMHGFNYEQFNES